VHIQQAHPWGCPVYVLDPRLQDGLKLPKWEPRSRRGIFMRVSPLHASTVGLILNPNTNRLSPQYHCVYDDFFETVHGTNDDTPPANWDELVINNRFRNEIEGEIEDTWNILSQEPVRNPSQQPSATEPAHFRSTQSEREPLRIVPEPQPDETVTPPTMESVNDTPIPVDEIVNSPAEAPIRGPRRSTRVPKPVDRFKFDKAHGYRIIVNYVTTLITCLCANIQCR
jgi:hypothetical protein